MKVTLRNAMSRQRIHPAVTLRNAGLLLATAAGITACSHAAPSPARNLTDVVINGKPGLHRIHDRAQLPASLQDLVDAIGMTSSGCTATHVGGGRVLTAGHCLETPEACALTSVHWAYLAGRIPSMTSRCTRLLSYERRLGGDYALFEVDQAPDRFIAPGPTPTPGPKGYPVTMLGHPSGAPLHWSGSCLMMIPKDLPADISRNQAHSLIFHQCPCGKGSSGSPLIDPRTMRLVGIHSGTIRPWSIATPTATYALL